MRELIREIQIDGASVRLRTLAPAGRSRDQLGPSVVLLHGLGGAKTMRGLHRELSRRHRTIAVDWAEASSPHPSDPGGARASADRIARALVTVGASDCVVIGHGRGSQIAVELSHAAPDLVRAVGCIGPTTDDRRRGAVRQAVDATRDIAGEPFLLGCRVLAGIARAGRRDIRVLEGALRYPLFKRIAELRVPVLLIRGHADVLCRHDWARKLIGVAEAGALIELPGLHHVHAESPGAVAALVDEFLRVDAVGRLR